MKGRIIGTLFALPFFGVGVWMLWSVSSSMVEVRDMRSWQPTPAQLTSAGYTTNYGDDSNTYEAFAEYTYQYLGQTFSGNRVGIAPSWDYTNAEAITLDRWTVSQGTRVVMALVKMMAKPSRFGSIQVMVPQPPVWP